MLDTVLKIVRNTDILRGTNEEFSGTFAEQLQKATIIRPSVCMYGIARLLPDGFS